MDELQLILKTIDGLGADAKSAFIWWVVAKHIIGNVTGICIFGSFLFGAYKMGMHIIRMTMFAGKLCNLLDLNGSSEYDRDSALRYVQQSVKDGRK